MRTLDTAELPASLPAPIAAALAQRCALPRSPQLRRAWMVRTPYSHVYRMEYTAPGWQQRVYAKVQPDKFTGAEAVNSPMRLEFEVLARCRDGLQLPGDAGTIEPLVYLADVPAIVTLDAPGLTLRQRYSRDARLYSPPGAGARLVGLAGLCGEWLQAFHALFASPAEHAFDAQDYLDYCRVRIGRLHTSMPEAFDANVVRRLEAAASRRLDRLGPGAHLAGVHSDFAAHNIVATRTNGIRVLDFADFDNGLAAFDVCNFWLELEMYKSDPSYRKDLLTQMQQTFLCAHGHTDVNSPDFELARLRYSMNRLLELRWRPDALRLVSPYWHGAKNSLTKWLRSLADSENRPIRAA